MVQIEGNRKDGFFVLVTTHDGTELLRSKMFNRKHQASRWLARLMGQLEPKPEAVRAAARSVGGRESVKGTEIEELLDAHESRYAAGSALDVISLASQMMVNALEHISRAPATDLVVETRKVLAELDEYIQREHSKLSGMVEEDFEKPDADRGARS